MATKAKAKLPPKPRTNSKALDMTPALIPPVRKVIPIALGLPQPPIKSWSFSSLQVFSECKHHSYLQRVLKEPEPDRPLPPGKSEHANDRGSRLHDECEQFIRGNLKTLPRELHRFSVELHSLRDSFKKGIVMLEEEWGMTRDWEPTAYKTATLRLKLDALVFISPTHAVVVDYKSGRKFGNEAKHAMQVQLYQLVTFLRFPQLETVTVELWYLDQDDEDEVITQNHFTRMQGIRFRKGWELKSDEMLNATSFPTNANAHSCRYCPYGPRGSGVCAEGV